MIFFQNKNKDIFIFLEIKRFINMFFCSIIFILLKSVYQGLISS